MMTRRCACDGIASYALERTGVGTMGQRKVFQVGMIRRCTCDDVVSHALGITCIGTVGQRVVVQIV